jgi:hypothetical protein
MTNKIQNPIIIINDEEVKINSSYDISKKEHYPKIVSLLVREHDKEREMTLEEYKKTCLSLVKFMEELTELMDDNQYESYRYLFRHHFPDNLIINTSIERG